MQCPVNQFGQPSCCVVPHPDRPDTEAFCSTCLRRFHYRGDFSFDGTISLLLGGLLLLFLL